jgi:hypothetical protein
MRFFASFLDRVAYPHVHTSACIDPEIICPHIP